ncbi:hypothetical protein FEP65_05566 [Burkholderia multivorans]|nr:hypothetical protein [Burkholderia multivorans]
MDCSVDSNASTAAAPQIALPAAVSSAASRSSFISFMPAQVPIASVLTTTSTDTVRPGRPTCAISCRLTRSPKNATAMRSSLRAEKFTPAAQLAGMPSRSALPYSAPATIPTISGDRPSAAIAGSCDRLVTAAANSATNSTPFNWPRIDGAAWPREGVGAVDMGGTVTASLRWSNPKFVISI